MKTIPPRTLGCFLIMAACALSSSASQLVEMRLVAGKPSDGAEEMKLGKETLSISKPVLISQSDLRMVAVSTNTPAARPQVGLVFEFSEGGWEHFMEVTRRNDGKRLAVIIEGQIYGAPVIRHDELKAKAERDRDQIFEFHGLFSEQKACELADRIDKALRKTPGDHALR